jgi:crotonobetaine/carnitine-CoA ligase
LASATAVVVLLENCPEALLVFFACAWRGAQCVPVNAASTAAELTYVVDKTQAAGIVTQPALLPVARAACGRAWLVVTETDAGRPPAASVEADAVQTQAFASLLAEPLPPAEVDPSTPAAVLFTSGTTARPKGVVWTHANVLWGAKMGALQEGLRATDVHLVFLPLFHVVALTWSVLPTMWVGGSLVLQPRFSASRFWDTALAHRCTWASMVPFCTAVLAARPIPEAHSFRMWGHAVYAPAYEALFKVRLLGWWGMTELVTHGIVGDPALPQSALTIGRPSVAYPVRVLDPSGAPSRVGETGELRIRGEPGVSIFLEYLGDPQATRAAFDEDGFFRTGDRVVVQEDGAIRFVRPRQGRHQGRRRERRGARGRARHRGRRRRAGGRRRRWPGPDPGEVPVAYVTLRDAACGHAALAQAVLDRCRRELARFKVPREVVVVDAFPRVSIGKISKAELRQRLQAAAARGDPP